MYRINDQTKLVKGIKSRNRIVMPPMDTLMAENGIANDFHIQHYGARAYGGVGTIIVESTAVSSEGRIREKDLGLWNDEQIIPMKRIADIAHQAGAVIGVQLNHAGAKAELDIETFGTTKYFDYLDQSKLTILTPKEIARIEEDFVQAASRAKQAGFDFVELHAAHGYLLNEIYHPFLNTIDDEKDIVKRSQLIINIASRIEKEVGIRMGIRLSIVDDVDYSELKIEHMKPLVEALDPFMDYFHISSGSNLANVDFLKLMADAGTKLFRIGYAKEVRKWTDKNIITVGNYQTREDVEFALKENVDFVAIGREVIANPNVTINNLLDVNEMDDVQYHWNQNLWFTPKQYKDLIESLNKKEK
ncbi:hypothetical protein [[Acholeplasma] multilocale]|uniref:oxidoreductase n=1 Tax=[Acholeplasma] multilocale TaxID=264638 RepID=UPI00047E18FE|nr:hypothetical protein [[Acholeplasma] multilocale]